MQAIHSVSRMIVASHIVLANTCLARAKGLMGRSVIAAGDGLWIVPCAMVHTFFMRFPIDVLFLDKHLRVMRVLNRLAPWRFSPWIWGAHSVLEMSGGSLTRSVKAG